MNPKLVHDKLVDFKGYAIVPSRYYCRHTINLASDDYFTENGITKEDNFYNVAAVYEYMNAGDLSNKVHSLSLTMKHRIEALLDVAKGLKHMHANGLSHGDLKPHNVMLRSDDEDNTFSAKLIDFGSLAMRDSDPVRGTYGYYSPREENTPSIKKSEKSDVYAFGMTMLEVLTGLPPTVVVLAPTTGRIKRKDPFEKNYVERWGVKKVSTGTKENDQEHNIFTK